MVNLFFKLVYVCDAILIGALLFSLRKSWFDKSFYFILIYCIVNSVTNTVNNLLPNIYRQVGAIFTILEYCVFALLIGVFTNSKFQRNIIKNVTGVFIVFVTLLYFFFENSLVDSLPIAAETILIFIYAFGYFYQEINDLEGGFIYGKYHFWIITGILIYLGGSFFIYVFANHIEHKDINDFWSLTYLFYVIKNLFFGLALFQLQQSKRSRKQKDSDLLPSYR